MIIKNNVAAVYKLLSKDEKEKYTPRFAIFDFIPIKLLNSNISEKLIYLKGNKAEMLFNLVKNIDFSDEYTKDFFKLFFLNYCKNNREN